MTSRPPNVRFEFRVILHRCTECTTPTTIPAEIFSEEMSSRGLEKITNEMWKLCTASSANKIVLIKQNLLGIATAFGSSDRVLTKHAVC